MTNPMHVKRSKELDDNLPTKHDRKDALVIARLVKDGSFSYPRILKGMEAELRAGSTFRSKLIIAYEVSHMCGVLSQSVRKSEPPSAVLEPAL